MDFGQQNGRNQTVNGNVLIFSIEPKLIIVCYHYQICRRRNSSRRNILTSIFSVVNFTAANSCATNYQDKVFNIPWKDQHIIILPFRCYVSIPIIACTQNVERFCTTRNLIFKKNIQCHSVILFCFVYASGNIQFIFSSARNYPIIYCIKVSIECHLL